MRMGEGDTIEGLTIILYIVLTTLTPGRSDKRGFKAVCKP
jgi:hypothetical protein